MYQQKMNQISYQKEVELISKKGLTKDLINKYKILNGAIFFLQTYYKSIQYLVAPPKFIHESPEERQKKVLKN